MDEILASKYRKRMFYGTSMVTFVALISLRFFVLPHFEGQFLSPFSIIDSIIDNLASALVASLAATSLIVWLTPPLAEMNTTNVKNLLVKLGLDSQDLSDASIDNILLLAKKAEDPYV